MLFKGYALKNKEHIPVFCNDDCHVLVDLHRQ